MKYSKCLSYPLPFYATHKINVFLYLRIPTNPEKVEGLSANGKILTKGSDSLF
jgi:hypothetical protein